MPFANRKISGVLNNSDSGMNEMSYVDMHDLHPENVQAAQVRGAINGAVSGATLASIPAAIVALFTGRETEKVANQAESINLSGKSLGVAAVIIAAGALVMGVVRSYTAKKEAETHNKWSEHVLARMEAREATEAKHAAAITDQREQAAKYSQQAARK